MATKNIRNKRRRAGPTGPIAGFAEPIDRANEQKAQPAEIANLLAALRRGDPGATETMREKFEYLLYQVAGDRNGDRFGERYIGFTTAIDRLAANSEDDAETFIVAELKRADERYYASESRNILPNAATNSNRKRKGQCRYSKLQRKGSRGDLDPREPLANHHRDRLPDELEDSALDTGPILDQRGNLIDNPDLIFKRDISTATELVDLKLDLTRNAVEESVFELLQGEASRVDIAAATGLTMYSVRTMVAAFRVRAIKAGYVDAEAASPLVLLLAPQGSASEDAPTVAPDWATADSAETVVAIAA